MVSMVSMESMPRSSATDVITDVCMGAAPALAQQDAAVAGRPQHHEQAQLCRARAPYRQGRKLTAVKVYSVCAESPHLLLYGVPALRLRRELRALLTSGGPAPSPSPSRLVSLSARADPAAAPFTDTYHARYSDVRAARAAKLRHDARNWYGGSLHVCYAPELESVAETRDKLRLRREQVAARLRILRRAADQPAHTLTLTLAHTCAEKSTAARCAHSPPPAAASRKRPKPLTNTILLEKQYRPCFLPGDTLPRSARTSPPIAPVPDDTRVNIASGGSHAPLRDSGARGCVAAEPVRVCAVPAAPLNRIKFTFRRRE